MAPKLSILMGTYLAQDRIAGIIDPVLKLDIDFEFVINDNASTDATFEVLKSYDDPRLKLTRNDVNVGAVRNLDSLIDRATGDTLTVLMDDDLTRPDSLLARSELLDAYPDVDLVYTAVSYRQPDGSVHEATRNPLLASSSYTGRTSEFDSLIRTNYIHQNAATLRRQALERVCGRPWMNGRLLLGDWDFFLRVARVSRTAFLRHSGVVVSIRNEGGSHDYRRTGYFALAHLQTWRRYLVDDPNPPVIYVHEWEMMRAFLGGSDDPSSPAFRPRLLAQFDTLMADYQANQTALLGYAEASAQVTPWLAEVEGTLRQQGGDVYSRTVPLSAIRNIDVWRDDVECEAQGETHLLHGGDRAAVVGWSGSWVPKQAPRVLLLAPAGSAEWVTGAGLALLGELRALAVHADLATTAAVPVTRYDLIHVFGGATTAPGDALRIPTICSSAVGAEAVAGRAEQFAGSYTATLASHRHWLAYPVWSDAEQWQSLVTTFVSAVHPDDRLILTLYAGLETGSDTATCTAMLGAFLADLTPPHGHWPDVRVSEHVPGERLSTALMLGNVYDRHLLDYFGARQLPLAQWTTEYLTDQRGQSAQAVEAAPDWRRPADAGVAPWSYPQRWFHAPEWEAHEDWEAVLAGYVKAFRPGSGSVLQLLVLSGSGYTTESAYSLLESWLQAERIDPEEIPDIEIVEQAPADEVTWALCALGEPAPYGFDGRTVTTLAWSTLCAAQQLRNGSS